MTREEMLETYHESTALLIYRGPYTASEFFAIAIAKKAFMSVFERSPRIFNTKDVFNPEGLSAIEGYGEIENSHMVLPYKNGRVFNNDGVISGTNPILDAWNRFGSIVEPNVKVADLVYKTFIRNISSPRLGSRDGIDFFLQLCNPSWEEVNNLLSNQGYKEMFSLQKRYAMSGINMASNMLNRLIDHSHSKIQLGKIFDSAFEASVKDPRLVLSEDHVIIMFNEKYRLYDPAIEISRHCKYSDSVAFVVQPNFSGNDIVEYYAKSTYNNFWNGINFSTYLSGDRWKNLRLLADGNAIKCKKDDFDLLIDFCHYVYRMCCVNQESTLPKVGEMAINCYSKSISTVCNGYSIKEPPIDKLQSMIDEPDDEDESLDLHDPVKYFVETFWETASNTLKHIMGKRKED